MTASDKLNLLQQWWLSPDFTSWRIALYDELSYEFSRLPIL